jgi:hypothetical protein
VDLTEDLCNDLGVALNEATLVDVAVDPSTWTGYVTLAVLTLQEEGLSPEDNRVLLVLQPVGRIAASLRHGLWNDPSAPVEQFTIDQLSEIVRSFGQLPIYGWEFFDVPESGPFSQWSDRLSLDVRRGTDACSHTLDLFQDDAGRRILDLRLWFERLEVRDPRGAVIPLDRFAADGRRWWDALHRGNSRTAGSGIIPL